MNGRIATKVSIFLKKEDKALYIWLIAITVVNLLQALFLPLHFDEAYYWVFSHQLDWGYFDHPPMAALWIKLGSFVPNPIVGVRLVTVLAQTIISWLFWRILPKRETDRRGQVNLFFLITLSLPLIHMFGFITTPDAPLMFFSLFYIVQFVRFSKNSTLFNAFGLGVLMALLAYSKYHGAILVLASIVANHKVLKLKQFWLAGCVALLCFFPHLYWQYQHDWASFRFHLTDRSSPFLWSDFITIVGGILGVFNPLLWNSFYKGVRQWRSDMMSRVMSVSFFFYIGFILITSLRGPAQLQWTMVASFGYIYMSYLSLYQNSLKRPLRIALISLLSLFIAIRIALICIPALQPRIGFWGEQQHDLDITTVSAGNPVIFDTSYSDAASYIFYQKRFDVHNQARIATPNGQDFYFRSDQFQMWNIDESFRGKKVYYITPFADSTKTFSDGRALSYSVIENYIPTHKVQGRFLNRFSSPIPLDSSLRCEVELHNSYLFDFPLQDGTTELKLHYGTIGQFSLSARLLTSAASIPSKGTLRLIFSIPSGVLPVGEGELFLCVSRPPLGYWYAARSPKIEIR